MLHIDGHRLQAFCLELGVMNRDLPGLLRQAGARSDLVAFVEQLGTSRRPAPDALHGPLCRVLDVTPSHLDRAGVFFEPARM